AKLVPTRQYKGLSGQDIPEGAGRCEQHERTFREKLGVLEVSPALHAIGGQEVRLLELPLPLLPDLRLGNVRPFGPQLLDTLVAISRTERVESGIADDPELLRLEADLVPGWIPDNAVEAALLTREDFGELNREMHRQQLLRDLGSLLQIARSRSPFTGEFRWADLA